MKIVQLKSKYTNERCEIEYIIPFIHDNKECENEEVPQLMIKAGIVIHILTQASILG